MYLFLSFIFLMFALATGANVYIIKSTVSHWCVSALSAFASFTSAWSVVYCAIRFFYDPAKIVVDTFVLNVALTFPNHPETAPVVVGNFWLAACLVPMVVACLVVRELRKIPKTELHAPAAPGAAEEKVETAPV